MLAPAEGEIVAVNEKAISIPRLVAQDPYGAGWLLEIFSPDIQVSFRNLLTGAFARRWMEESVAELRQAISPGALATALDGGTISPHVGTELPRREVAGSDSAVFPLIKNGTSSRMHAILYR